MMSESNNVYKWFAVYVKSRTEKKVHSKLIEKKINSFLPLQKILKQWSDRKKWIEEPLIKSYLFVKITEEQRLSVLNTGGAVRFLTYLGKPAAIPQNQIDVLLLSQDDSVEREIINEKIEIGSKVEIIGGPFKGHKGLLIEYNNKQMFSIEISHIGYSILLKIPDKYLYAERA